MLPLLSRWFNGPPAASSPAYYRVLRPHPNAPRHDRGAVVRHVKPGSFFGVIVGLRDATFWCPLDCLEAIPAGVVAGWNGTIPATYDPDSVGAAPAAIDDAQVVDLPDWEGGQRLVLIRDHWEDARGGTPTLPAGTIVRFFRFIRSSTRLELDPATGVRSWRQCATFDAARVGHVPVEFGDSVCCVPLDALQVAPPLACPFARDQWLEVVDSSEGPPYAGDDDTPIGWLGFYPGAIVRFVRSYPDDDGDDLQCVVRRANAVDELRPRHLRPIPDEVILSWGPDVPLMMGEPACPWVPDDWFEVLDYPADDGDWFHPSDLVRLVGPDPEHDRCVVVIRNGVAESLHRDLVRPVPEEEIATWGAAAPLSTRPTVKPQSDEEAWAQLAAIAPRRGEHDTPLDRPGLHFDADGKLRRAPLAPVAGPIGPDRHAVRPADGRETRAYEDHAPLPFPAPAIAADAASRKSEVALLACLALQALADDLGVANPDGTPLDLDVATVDAIRGQILAKFNRLRSRAGATAEQAEAEAALERIVVAHGLDGHTVLDREVSIRRALEMGLAAIPVVAKLRRWAGLDDQALSTAAAGPGQFTLAEEWIDAAIEKRDRLIAHLEGELESRRGSPGVAMSPEEASNRAGPFLVDQWLRVASLWSPSSTFGVGSVVRCVRQTTSGVILVERGGSVDPYNPSDLKPIPPEVVASWGDNIPAMI